MLTKYAVAGLAASAMLASVAFAQNPSATTDRATTAAPAAASETTSFKGNWRTSKLVGLNVYNDSNESLGSINDLLTDKSRRGERRQRVETVRLAVDYPARAVP